MLEIVTTGLAAAAAVLLAGIVWAQLSRADAEADRLRAKASKLEQLLLRSRRTGCDLRREVARLTHELNGPIDTIYGRVE